MWGHGSPYQFPSLYSVHKRNIFLRPVELDMYICHIDTEAVIETPFHSLLWLPRSSGKRFVNLCSHHCPHTGRGGTVLTSVGEYVHLLLVQLSSTKPFCYQVQNTEFQIPVAFLKIHVLGYSSKCISYLATKESKNGQEASLRCVQI